MTNEEAYARIDAHGAKVHEEREIFTAQKQLEMLLFIKRQNRSYGQKRRYEKGETK